ncbi:hypothetical protein GOP47_0006190 [Adiantum capillus-veneris]|uniref:Uncharacterized protein n=1 Tax=Adiantum capillus-veneris TaxID=13818 RepID=A0A9D4ZK60_ADICA|nr:hypothetical protein GOP47_0006190 [Adiantum capillus-veneris]
MGTEHCKDCSLFVTRSYSSMRAEGKIKPLLVAAMRGGLLPSLTRRSPKFIVCTATMAQGSYLARLPSSLELAGNATAWDRSRT